jgi:hypothetical protein
MKKQRSFLLTTLGLLLVLSIGLATASLAQNRDITVSGLTEGNGTYDR